MILKIILVKKFNKVLDLIFNDLDDEILRNMRNTEHFEKLCEEKGKNNVYLRIDYLKI